MCSTDVDDNCDGDTNENTADAFWYEDGDNDTYGDENSTMMACGVNEYVSNNTTVTTTMMSQ